MRQMLVLGLLLSACGGASSTNDAAVGTKDFSSGAGDLSGGATDLASPAAKYTFGGGSATATFVAGQAPPTAQIASTVVYPGTSTFSFTGTPGASGTVVITEAFNHAIGGPADVTPDTLPAVTGVSNSPMLYYSFYQGGASTISVSGASLAFTTDPSSIFGGYLGADISCVFNLYDPVAQTWSPGGMVPLAGGASSFTISDIVPGETLSFAPGQTLGAVSCD